MRWVLLLLLPTALSSGGAGRLPERAPIFHLIQQDPWTSQPNTTTISPCEGLPAMGTTTLTLTNSSLERLPSCLPGTLRSLDGSHNLLRALSAQELGHLAQLQMLSLHHNLIASLHWGPGGPAGLHTLDLSYNQLTALPSCTGEVPSSLRELLLVGNPLQELQPEAFSCFPELRLLNLSSTELGRGAHVGIADAAFTGAGRVPLATLEVLDLSSTFLTWVQAGWIRDLPKLTSLYLRKMPRLGSLEGDIFKMTPELQQLDCQDSPALTSVHTQIFQDTPSLQQLLLQNCNLSSFPPWTLRSSQVLSISLFGNPLTCSCELSWLLMDTKNIVLHRAADTECKPAAGSTATLSTPLSLSKLQDVCNLDQSITLPHSNSVSSVNSTQPPYTTQVPSTLTETAPTTQPGAVRPNFLPVESSPGTSWPHSSGEEWATHSPTISAATSSSTQVPPRAASTATTVHRNHAAQLVLEPNTSAASSHWTGNHSGLFPTSRDPVSTSQPSPRTQVASQLPHLSSTQGEIPLLLLDDSSEEDEREKMGALARDVPCDYHPCKHLQTPCAVLQRRFRCLCPGLSGEDTLPDPPKLLGVSETTDTSALISWCAPNSVVQGYQIHYSPEGWQGNQSVVGDIYATARQHPLYGLEPGTTYLVCVQAVNRAGLSPPEAEGWSGACATFTTKPSFMLIFAGLCAASGLLLLSSLLLAMCLCRRQGRTSHQQRYDTHLVAYKNPAFDYPLKLQSLN